MLTTSWFVTSNKATQGTLVTRIRVTCTVSLIRRVAKSWTSFESIMPAIIASIRRTSHRNSARNSLASLDKIPSAVRVRILLLALKKARPRIISGTAVIIMTELAQLHCHWRRAHSRCPQHFRPLMINLIRLAAEGKI